MPPKYTWFTEEEAKGIEPDLMAMLDVARARAGVPFVITCGLRTPEHNAEVGGEHDSAHLPNHHGLSYAVDIACDNSEDRFAMVFALEDAGLRRIVLEPQCIHVDIDESKPQDVLAFWERHD